MTDESAQKDLNNLERAPLTLELGTQNAQTIAFVAPRQQISSLHLYSHIIVFQCKYSLCHWFHDGNNDKAAERYERTLRQLLGSPSAIDIRIPPSAQDHLRYTG